MSGIDELCIASIRCIHSFLITIRVPLPVDTLTSTNTRERTRDRVASSMSVIAAAMSEVDDIEAMLKPLWQSLWQVYRKISNAALHTSPSFLNENAILVCLEGLHDVVQESPTVFDDVDNLVQLLQVIRNLSQVKPRADDKYDMRRSNDPQHVLPASQIQRSILYLIREVKPDQVN